MIGAVLAVFLQATAPQVAAEGAAPVRESAMACTYDRAARVRNCTTAEGEQLVCRRERQLGSRFSTWVCLTAEQDRQIQEDTRQQMDRQQRITTPGVG
jgi:hypothetical protein